jgi:hypothetical protein
MRLARGISVTNTSKPISTAPAYDADATAFFTAASITDTTQKSAVNTLVLSLKSANIWTKMKALYPVVGGVASSHAVNLKQPSTFNLSFATGWTHSSTGMTPNGATYANTSLIPSSAPLTVNNTHLSVYSRTSSNLGNTDIGQIWINGGTQAYGLYSSCGRSTDNNAVGALYSSDGNRIIVNQINASGFFVTTRNSTSSFKLFQNNILKGSNSTVNTSVYQGLGQNSILIGALNYYNISEVPQNQFTNYSQKQYAFASIGNGLTDAEALSFYNAVQTYQTTLGRQV